MRVIREVENDVSTGRESISFESMLKWAAKDTDILYTKLLLEIHIASEYLFQYRLHEST